MYNWEEVGEVTAFFSKELCPSFLTAPVQVLSHLNRDVEVAWNKWLILLAWTSALNHRHSLCNSFLHLQNGVVEKWDVWGIFQPQYYMTLLLWQHWLHFLLWRESVQSTQLYNTLLHCLKIIELSHGPPASDFPPGYGCGGTIDNAMQRKLRLSL